MGGSVGEEKQFYKKQIDINEWAFFLAFVVVDLHKMLVDFEGEVH